ncbi:aminoglycoside 6-adenylyltransferase [Bacillaceae bacterium SIJ1]|uniref:aminoglycoside 6-adenylyltransferase n=1 Tax=Litoribacterium kuwaitense TaxID=1398745 RepID=UPI0013EB44C6|nr:aminoglycoside 6-adenylyltransferase [Litoribacterium kuwaitense]NGP44814.1 aminoglycoside 6-adenylyltransferase [Litoribacterium kuwaitense]
MRTTEEMMRLIIGTAKDDTRVRAVMMNGSRVNPNAPNDRFQDYDIVYFVTDLSSFTQNHRWVDRFGERVIMQMPDAFDLYETDVAPDDRFAYLMQFTDGNRIDLTLRHVTDAQAVLASDSLREVLLDKDGLFPDDLPPSNDRDYHIQKPSEERFLACCNEFFWVSTYVAKGLWRQELSFAKAAMEGPVRKMLILLLEWSAAKEHQFAVSVGKDGKWLQHFLNKDIWETFVATYPDGSYTHMWNALEEMFTLFRKVGREVAEDLGYTYPLAEDERVVQYVAQVRASAHKTEEH